MKQEKQQEIALMRYGAIAPIIALIDDASRFITGIDVFYVFNLAYSNYFSYNLFQFLNQCLAIIIKHKKL